MTVKIRALVTTGSSDYGRLEEGLEYEVDDATAEHWIRNRIAVKAGSNANPLTAEGLRGLTQTEARTQRDADTAAANAVRLANLTGGTRTASRPIGP